MRLADVELEQARARAAVEGRTLTGQQEARIRQESLQRQAGDATGPVAGELRDLISDLNFPQMLRLQNMADRREARADRRADRLEANAKDEFQHARTMEKAANKLDRFADRLPGAIAKAFSTAYRQNLSERELERMIRRILAAP